MVAMIPAQRPHAPNRRSAVNMNGISLQIDTQHVDTGADGDAGDEAQVSQPDKAILRTRQVSTHEVDFPDLDFIRLIVVVHHLCHCVLKFRVIHFGKRSKKQQVKRRVLGCRKVSRLPIVFDVRQSGKGGKHDRQNAEADHDISRRLELRCLKISNRKGHQNRSHRHYHIGFAVGHLAQLHMMRSCLTEHLIEMPSGLLDFHCTLPSMSLARGTAANANRYSADIVCRNEIPRRAYKPHPELRTGVKPK